ncbi:MAG: FkbM family methyltransferase [Magnetococcales bacterium]|nr:FkbM family methyltransferase [Magnetococcales bacterium]
MWASTCLRFQGQIFAFEPDQVNFDRLGQQIILNRLDMVHIERQALWNEPGVKTFTVGKDMENHIPFNGVEVEDGPEKTVSIKVDSLDNYAKTHHIERIDLIKVDVEGGEYFVLEGAKNFLSEQKIVSIQLEFNENLGHGNVLGAETVKNYLLGFGYHLYEFDPGMNTLHPFKLFKGMGQKNLLAIADLSLVQTLLKEKGTDLRFGCAPEKNQLTMKRPS